MQVQEVVCMGREPDRSARLQKSGTEGKSRLNQCVFVPDLSNPRTMAGLRVQYKGDLVPGRAVELLDHPVSHTRSEFPVDPLERVSVTPGTDFTDGSQVFGVVSTGCRFFIQYGETFSRYGYGDPPRPDNDFRQWIPQGFMLDGQQPERIQQRQCCHSQPVFAAIGTGHVEREVIAGKGGQGENVGFRSAGDQRVEGFIGKLHPQDGKGCTVSDSHMQVSGLAFDGIGVFRLDADG